MLVEDVGTAVVVHVDTINLYQTYADDYKVWILRSTSISLFVLLHSHLLRELVMVRISSLIWCLPTSFQSQAFLLSASNLDLKSFVIVVRSSLICFSSISLEPYTRRGRGFCSCSTQSIYVSLFPPLEEFIQRHAPKLGGSGDHLYEMGENLQDGSLKCRLCLSWHLTWWSWWVRLCAELEFSPSFLMYTFVTTFR